MATLLLLALLPGCTITATSESPAQRATNTCSSSDECDNGNCVNNVCQTAAGQLESLLIEVTPPSDSNLAHIPLIKHVEQVPTSGGGQDLLLTHAAHVTGSLFIPPGSECETSFYLPDGKLAPPSSNSRSIPATVTLTPRDALLGLPSQVYQVRTDTLTVFPEAGAQYVFDLQVPAGDYDVYVVPPVRQEGCQVPPQLYRRQSIPRDTDLQFPVAPTKTPLSLTIAFPPSSTTLEGWVVDIIEHVSGNRISTEQVLGAPDADGNYFVPLAYSTVVEQQVAEDETDVVTDLIRLRPPPGLVAPTVYADRSGLGLFSSPDEAVLGAFTKFPEAVTVEGQLTSLEDKLPVGGQVTFVSTQIFGVDEGVFASYQATVDAPEEGVFRVELPPGKYRVYAVPPLAGPGEPGLSAHEVSWEVPADVSFQAGRLIELPPLADLTGTTSLQGARVQVVASPQSVLPFEEAFGAAAFVPRATADMVDAQGEFRVEADPGRFDILVRPPQASGFGWFARAGYQVQPGGGAQDLGRLVLPAPAMMTGVVRVALAGELNPIIPSALIRAYAYLDKNMAYTRDRTQAHSVIQVAETRSDELGNFRLLVPASIDAPK